MTAPLESWEVQVSVECPTCGREIILIVGGETAIDIWKSECGCCRQDAGAMLTLERRALAAAYTPPEPEWRTRV